MPERRSGSIRLWQTELFVAVIVVAMLILSGSLSAGLRTTLARMATTSEIRNASALAQRLEPEIGGGLNASSSIKAVVADYRDIYGGGIWVYAEDGQLIESNFDGGPDDATLEAARLAGISEEPSYTSVDFRQGGWVVASKPLNNASGVVEGVVVTASSVDEQVAIMRSVRSRLWTTFWVSLVVAGLLGFSFSQLISRRITEMKEAAASMAAGDFERRLPLGFIPDEVRDLAISYNQMAEQLGEAFGELQDSQRQIAAVVEQMAEGVIAFDSDGIVRVVNPEAERLLCMEDCDLYAHSLPDVTGDEQVLEVVQLAFTGKSSARTIFIGPFVVLLHCTPLLEAEGKVEGAVLLLADVTEQYRIEDAQRRFIADASHEMRTPIAALKGMLELLEDGAKDVPEVRDDFIHTMSIEADRLARLVSDMLTLARLEAGTLKLEITPESAADLLGDVARVMHTLAEGAGVTLAVDVEDPELRVRGDRDRIVQVLLSFVDNALKHSPEGTSVHLAARRRGDIVRLEVRDEGSGIPAEQLSRVFERFFRADEARAGAKGTGLGLAIAKEIVEAHGSSIEVASHPGDGTTFGFDLPVA
ncbi:MAG TPA: ATP-binding protein [Coriobacteriia bacterium]|nr:ATP-binding protein [Coriobacteriia bacterium]